MARSIEDIITSAVYSFKNREFTMPDIFLVVGSFCTQNGYEITIEQICNTVDKLGETGVI
ncbi:MAG: hypothetical protein K2J20_01005 [Bacilli bacterium]|nr:hypothetical protein [Bacilli bacterium]